MDQAVLFLCVHCKIKKPKSQFKLHSKDTKHVKRGNPLSQCLPCVVKVYEGCEKNKRKHDKEVPSPSESREEPNSIIHIEQFIELLAELARGHMIDCSAWISRQGMIEEEEDIFKLIVKQVWEATGFRFTYVWFLLEV